MIETRKVDVAWPSYLTRKRPPRAGVWAMSSLGHYLDTRYQRLAKIWGIDLRVKRTVDAELHLHVAFMFSM